VVGYLRVSTDDQALGPVAQREALARWCAANGAELVAVFADLGVSGGAPLDRRPELLAALDALEAHGAGVLLVAKRDRLARDPVVAAMIEAAAERVGARVASAAGEGEGADPTAILMRRIVDAFAEYERLMIRARTRAALGVKKARGERVGSVPYGFRLAADGVHLEADPAEARAVELVRSLRAEGLSLRAIGERLAAAGCVPRGGGAWHPDTVKRIAAAVAA
jgi:DNA invertase Pin-like site-specific DNA recombinase